jgi:hypothetical protein
MTGSSAAPVHNTSAGAWRKRVQISMIGTLLLLGAAPALAGKTQNVVLIVSDGLRWQEIFTGADPALLNGKEGGSWLAETELRCFHSCGVR